MRTKTASEQLTLPIYAVYMALKCTLSSLPYNIKITMPQDYFMFRALFGLWRTSNLKNLRRCFNEHLSTCIEAHLSGKRIVFFGAGQYSLTLMPLLYDKIAYFVDNSPIKQGTLFWGIMVYSPNKLLEEDGDETVIIVNAEYYQEIAKQCYDLGHKNIYAGMYKNANEIVPKSEFTAKNLLKRRHATLTESIVIKSMSKYAICLPTISRRMYSLRLLNY